MSDLALDTRYIYADPASCTECGRIVARRVHCADSSPQPCDAGYCWRCWNSRLAWGCGRVPCACGSTYGGVMSRYDCDELQSLWVMRFGYRSWGQAEVDNPEPAPDPSKRPAPMLLLRSYGSWGRPNIARTIPNSFAKQIPTTHKRTPFKSSSTHAPLCS